MTENEIIVERNPQTSSQQHIKKLINEHNFVDKYFTFTSCILSNKIPFYKGAF